jgi:hypothetical protein
VPNAFTYPVFLAYLDLDELPALFEGLPLASCRPSLFWFRRRDYLGPAEEPLGESVRRLVEERRGRRPRGPIRLLTHLRTFGVRRNPASFYYCFGEDGTTLEHVVVEITNTPWGERYCYVLDGGEEHPTAEVFTVRRRKVFHVSPFMEMDQEYRWRYSNPSEDLLLHVENFQGDEPLFDATVRLERRPWGRRELHRAALAHPFLTLRVSAWIYWQAFRLWVKGVPFVSHPKHGASADPARHTGIEPLGGRSHELFHR